MKKNIMYNFSREDHKRRLENIKFVEENIQNVFKKELITNYIQGQFIYLRRDFDTEENDDALLKMLGENGVGMVQIWEHMGRDENGEHYDYSHRLIDGKMYRPYGIKKEQTECFLDMAHKYGLKVIPYTSTNFYMRADSFFDPGWALPQDGDLSHLAHCSPNSPGWRAQIIRQYAGILDDYDYDGIYIDCGFVRDNDYAAAKRYYLEDYKAADEEILAFEESIDHDGAMEDMLALIYAEVKSRGGILKLHKEGCDRIQSKMKLYDYLWVGECVSDINYIRRHVKNYQPFVVPDYNFTINDDERYLNTIPYMQFPVMRNGIMGIGAPNSGYPDFDRQLKWLSLYQQIASTGTWCYIEAEIPALISNSDKNTVVSLFVNDFLYIVIANYGKNYNTVNIFADFTELEIDKAESAVRQGEIVIAPRSMKILKLATEFNVDDTSINGNLKEDLIGS